LFFFVFFFKYILMAYIYFYLKLLFLIYSVVNFYYIK